MTTAFRSGFACFVGRPNAGKSTLTNALVGSKVAITADQPQTTRHVIRGIVHGADGQLVLLDTPGVHRPRTLLGQRLNDLVRSTWAEVDVIGFCTPADEKPGPGDRFILDELAKAARATLVAVVTKSDVVTKQRLAEHLLAVSDLAAKAEVDFAEIVPVSAVRGDNLDVLRQVLTGRLPEGEPLYPDGELTDEPEAVMIAELVREAALSGVRDELPHSIACVVEEIVPRPDRPEDKPLLDVYVTIYVERDSQKGIVIGHRGARLREVGTAARQHITALLGTAVHLHLHVKVAKEWQRDPKQLRRLGF